VGPDNDIEAMTAFNVRETETQLFKTPIVNVRVIIGLGL